MYFWWIEVGLRGGKRKRAKETSPNDMMNQLLVFTTTSTYKMTVQIVSALLSSEQNSEECDATTAQ